MIRLLAYCGSHYSDIIGVSKRYYTVSQKRNISHSCFHYTQDPEIPLPRNNITPHLLG